MRNHSRKIVGSLEKPVIPELGGTRFVPASRNILAEPLNIAGGEIKMSHRAMEVRIG